MGKIIFYFFLCAVFDVCSAPNPLARIIVGDTVDIKNYPHQVSIRSEKYANSPPQHLCGGVVIDKNNILTAAHCLVYDDGGDGKIYARIAKLKIYAGTSKLDNQGSVHDVTNFKSHPDYDPKTFNNDIAVVKLSKPIEFSDTQTPIELPSHAIENGMEGAVTGWGDIECYSCRKPANNLQKITQTLIDNKKCQEVVKNVKGNPVIFESDICGYNKNKKKTQYRLRYPGVCIADSGGPLVADNKLVGIVSHGFNHKCAIGDPDVYTNVYAYLGFIKENIEN